MEIDLTPFINAGVSGVMLLWFMFRLERILVRFEKSVQLMARAVIRLLERRDPRGRQQPEQGAEQGEREGRGVGKRCTERHAAKMHQFASRNRGPGRFGRVPNPAAYGVVFLYSNVIAPERPPSGRIFTLCSPSSPSATSRDSTKSR